MLVDAAKLLLIAYLILLAVGSLMGWTSLILFLPVRAFHAYASIFLGLVTGGRRKLKPLTHRRFFDEIRDWRQELDLDRDVRIDEWQTGVSEAKDGS